MKRLKVFSVLLICIYNLCANATVVSDNDGAAFITKAEFDSLKNEFQVMIDSYNSQIDAKIDAAIASYLAGLSIKTKLNENFIGKSHGTRQFVNTFSLANTNQLGDYVEGISAIQVSGSNNDTKYKNNTNTYTNSFYVSLDTGRAAGPYKVSKGTNKDMLLYLNDSNWNKNYKVASSQIQSIPYTSWSGNWVSHSAPPVAKAFTKPSDFSIARSGSTVWGYQTQNITIDVGGRNVQCSGNAIFCSLDEIKTENVLSCLAGGTVSTTLLYTCHIDDKNTLGEQSTAIPIDKGYARCRYEGAAAIDASNTWLGTYKLLTYHHKYKQEYALSDLLVDSMSSAIDDDVRYYNGLPLFKASQDGTVKFTLKIVNDGNETSTVAIKNGKFGNSAISAGITLDSTSADWTVDEVKTWPATFNSNQEYKMEFKVKKGSYYYIKVLPKTSDHDSIVNIVGDIVNSTN